jgi:glutamate--cysteine ligase
MLIALPALWRGLLYDDRALAAAESLASALEYDAMEEARPSIAKNGLWATLQGREVADWSAQVLEIADGGLERLNALDARGRDERMYLHPLRERLERGETPADRLIAEIGAEPTIESVIEATKLR